MGDGFLDRVTAAVEPWAALRRDRPLGRLAGRLGADRRCRRAPRVLRDLRRGFRRSRCGGQAAGGLLRAAWRGRAGRTRAADRRRAVGRPRRDRRCQAGRHRFDRRCLRRRLVERGQPAGGRCRDRPRLSGPGRAGTPGPAGRETGRGVLVVARSSNPEGTKLQLATTAEGTAVEDMLLARDCRPERLRGWAGRCGRGGDRSHACPVKLPIVPARRGNSGSRAGRPGGRTGRRGDPFRRVRPRARVLPSSSRGVLKARSRPRRDATRGRRRWPANCPPPWPESRPVHMNTPGRGAMVSPCRNHPH